MSRLTINIVASFASKAWASLISLAFVPIYIKFLGVEAYGVVGAFVTLQTLMALFDLGFGPALTREMARLSAHSRSEYDSRDLLRTLELIYWAMAGAIGLLTALLAPLIATHWLRPEQLSSGDLRVAITAGGLAFALQWPTNLYAAGLIGLQRQVTLGSVIAVSGTLRALATVLALWLVAPALDVFFVAQAAVNFLQTASLALVLWKKLPVGSGRATFKRSVVRTVLPFATGMTGISLSAVALSQMDKVILSKLLPLQTFGYYAVAGTLASGLYVLVSPLFSALFPRFSQLVAAGDREALARLYDLSCQLLSALVLPVAAVIALFAPEILQLWTGNGVIASRSHLVLSLLIAGNAMNGLMNVPYALQLAHGWTSLAFYSNVAAIVLCAPLIYFLSMRLGPAGGALVWVLLTSGYILISLPLMHRRLLPGRLGRWYLLDTGRPAIAAFGVAGVARMLAPQALSGVEAALLLACAVGIGWLAAVLLAPDLRALVLSRLYSMQSAG